jgi:signal transduction histidine kinase
MPRRKKNITMLLLIASSLLLMILLQAFWIKNVFQDEYENFEKQADMSFHTVIQQIQDSVFQASIKPIREGEINVSDTCNKGFPPDVNAIKLDSPKVTIYTKNFHYQRPYNPKNEPDAESQYKHRKIRIQFHAKRDSMRGVFRSVIKNIHESSKQTHFVVNLENDSLPLSFLKQKFHAAFANISDETNFKILVADSPHEFMNQEKLQTTPCFAVTTQKFYTAQFDNIYPFLLRKIAPHILFLIFQFTLTIAAFVTIFRNWSREEKLLKMKNDFISNITHELKTPIATIGIAIEALRRYNALQNPQLTEDYLNISQNELNRLSLLTENIMRSALLEQRDFLLKKNETDWKDLVEKAIFSMKILFEKYQANVQCDFYGENFIFYGDILHLNNLVYNLLDNALKYGGENPEIYVRVQAEENEIILSVSDKGIGIPQSEQKRIFEKFYRIRHGDLHEVKGYGLGLSYVAEVVKRHNGEIKIDSSLGKGSCFTLIFPRN